MERDRSPLQAAKVEMDPMNRMERVVKDPKKAPSPAARFPASDEGWKDAIEYTKTKSLIGTRK